MAVPFEIAAFNLINFAQAYEQIFSSVAADVDVQVMDELGVISTVTVQNRGKFKQALWDDVGAALGQMSRSYWVDNVAGDDLNDGSEATPFQTIKKALQAASASSRVTISLKRNQVHQMSTSDKSINCKYATLKFQSYGTDPETAKIKWSWVEDATEVNLYGAIDFTGYSIVTGTNVEWTIDDNVSALAVNYKSPIRRDFSAATVIFFGGNSETHYIGDDACILHSAPHSRNSLGVYASNFTTSTGANKGKLVNCKSATCNISLSGICLVDGAALTSDYIDGLVLDTNNVPRNVVSNIVL